MKSMNPKSFGGILPALVTPYTAEGEVNYQELKRLVRRLIQQGVDGFYVTGSTAEVFLMTEDERRRVLEAVLEENNGEKTVISHVGSISTDAAVRFARHAEKSGADAVSAISPFYYQFKKQEIVDYYRGIMQSVDLPMFVYNFPAFSSFSLTEDVLEQLLSCPNLKGVKFTSSDFFLMERIKTKHPELTVFNGYDEMLLSGLAAGADGGIGSTYNCMAPLYRRIYDAFQAGDMQKARESQQRANYMVSVICKHGVFASIKAILEAQGFHFHGCRKPFSPLEEQAKAELTEAYEKYAASEV